MGRAASVLGIAQPALTRQVRLLEEALGVPLFIRSRRGMQLTEDGEQLRAAIRKPMREIELALQNVGAPSAPIEGIVVLGMPSATACPRLTAFSSSGVILPGTINSIARAPCSRPRGFPLADVGASKW